MTYIDLFDIPNGDVKNISNDTSTLSELHKSLAEECRQAAVVEHGVHECEEVWETVAAAAIEHLKKYFDTEPHLAKTSVVPDDRKVIWEGQVDELIMSPSCRVILDSSINRLLVEKANGRAAMGEQCWEAIKYNSSEYVIVLQKAVIDSAKK